MKIVQNIWPCTNGEFRCNKCANTSFWKGPKNKQVN